MSQGSNDSYSSSLDSQLGQYTTPLPDIAKAYLRSFSRGGPIDIPSFQELYGSYRDVAQKEADRQAQGINESFGSRGARYGSEILNAQNQLKQNLATDLRSQSGQFLTGLRTQQFNEALPLINLQSGLSESGMVRLFQDFLRRTSPPPLFGTGGQLSEGYGLPTKAIF